MQQVVANVRQHRQPWLVHAKTCLLNHHTSGVRKEFYRTEEDLAHHACSDPHPKLRQELLKSFSEEDILQLESEVAQSIKEQFEKAVAAAEPDLAIGKRSCICTNTCYRRKGRTQPGRW